MKLRYTPIDEVAGLLEERLQNEQLQDELFKLTYGSEPGGAYSLDSGPSLVLAEYVARPTVRDIALAKTAIEFGLSAAWASYRGDSFTTTNKKKVGMLRPPLALPNGQNTRQWIVNPEDRQSPNVEIGNVQTKYDCNQTVADYWQSLRGLLFPKWDLKGCENSVIDLTDAYRFWAQRNGETGKSIAKGYYPAIMAMYATRAALFAGFDPYSDFANKVTQPAYEYVYETLKVEPIIVRAPDTEALIVDESTGRRVEPDQTDLTFLSPSEVIQLQTTGCVDKELK